MLIQPAVPSPKRREIEKEAPPPRFLRRGASAFGSVFFLALFGNTREANRAEGRWEVKI
jgi:hypothetical protein